ncbi:hypothetical protein GE061_005921 [Apolygus lucorum]|uniref:Ribosomal RNA-processing protein 8 n=1 Tax=Apolygus lucorum TaxID=248454 RepID=A0A6A4J1V3_APOLU|nr:hypothetical protein GE061_005921 [Apolygus lucorum]
MKLNPSLNVSESSLKLHTKKISKKSKNVKKRNVTVKDTLLVTSGSPKSSKNKKKHVETSDLEGIGKVQGQKMEESRQEHAEESSVTSQNLSVSSVLEDRKSISNIQKKREKFKNSKNSSLREKMLSRLSAARFRFINEELYTWDGQESPKVFASNPKSFKAYHSGFKQQTKLWPVNPIDLIIKSIKKLPDYGEKVIADFGCGEAKLALELSSNKVYSFDLVAINDRVTVCDNANTKLYSGSVDIAVHCLSLMSSNISGYIKEANRVLKIGGTLKIAEVESRFENVDKFIENVSKFNFKLIKKDLTRNLFYFLDFEKVADIGVARKRKLPVLSLQPCLYKKR